MAGVAGNKRMAKTVLTLPYLLDFILHTTNRIEPNFTVSHINLAKILPETSNYFCGIVP